MEDVEPEIEYWTPSVVCHVVGANPPLKVQFPRLDAKYWGTLSLSKLESIIGRLLKTDKPTMEKSKLGYARVLIEVKIREDLPKEVDLITEKGILRKQEMFGHSEKDCKKKHMTRQVCVPRQQNVEPEVPRSSNPHVNTQTVQWLINNKLPKMRKKVLRAIAVAMWYKIWRARNDKAFNGGKPETTRLIECIKKNVRDRCLYLRQTGEENKKLRSLSEDQE
ncbi:hypothetical protein Cgig2_009742 [Carnegiea gigantea]|uniref:Uncharacterized protein n=1 Tax=Carnegiea gigantea TaxID=171969 RepID=A0A9Q1JWM4_9CARY|nr:hypothetical protein Cgig2_009742 [Carnegiea gigantea]